VLPVRALNVREQHDVAATFKDVTIEKRDAPDCSFADPCLIRRFTWTNHVARGEVTVNARDGSCAPRLSDAHAREITALVTSLLLDSR
jgi:hypothetical protein